MKGLRIYSARHLSPARLRGNLVALTRRSEPGNDCGSATLLRLKSQYEVLHPLASIHALGTIWRQLQDLHVCHGKASAVDSLVQRPSQLNS